MKMRQRQDDTTARKMDRSAAREKAGSLAAIAAFASALCVGEAANARPGQGPAAALVKEAPANLRDASSRAISTLQEYATLSAGAYNSTPSDVPGYRVVQSRELPSGLAYTVYQSVGSKDLVAAFRGTESLLDWGANADAAGINPANSILNQPVVPKQYQDALEAVRVLRAMDPDLELTGHSLGGGIADYVSSHTGLNAVTYNAAPVLSKLLGPHKDKSLHVCMDTDPVCAAKEATQGGSEDRQLQISMMDADRLSLTSADGFLPPHSMSSIRQWLYQERSYGSLRNRKLDAGLCGTLGLNDPTICEAPADMFGGTGGMDALSSRFRQNGNQAFQNAQSGKQDRLSEDQLRQSVIDAARNQSNAIAAQGRQTETEGTGPYGLPAGAVIAGNNSTIHEERRNGCPKERPNWDPKRGLCWSEVGRAR